MVGVMTVYGGTAMSGTTNAPSRIMSAISVPDAVLIEDLLRKLARGHLSTQQEEYAALKKMLSRVA
jgi:hypothetical protein